MRHRTRALVGLWGVALPVVALLTCLGLPSPPGSEGSSTRGPRPPSARGNLPRRGDAPVAGPREGKRFFVFQTAGPVAGAAAVADDGTIYLTSEDEHLYALGTHGLLAWKRDLEGPSSSAALVDRAGRVIAGTTRGRLFAFDRKGTELWSLDAGGAIRAGPVLGPDGTLLVAAGSDLLALHPDGRPAFRFRTAGRIVAAPAVGNDGTIYVGSRDDRLYAVSPDGSLEWSFRAGGNVDSGPVVTDDGSILVASDDGRVYRLSREGEVRWSTSLGGYVRAPLGLMPGDAVVASVYGPEARLVSLDLESGLERWSLELGRARSDEDGSTSGPLLDRDGYIYAGSHDGYLYALTPEGQIRWLARTGGPVDASPVLREDGVLLVGSSDGRLYALR